MAFYREHKFGKILINNFLLLILPIVVSLAIISAAVFNYEIKNIDQEIKAANISTLSKIKNTCDMLATEGDLILTKTATDNDTKFLLFCDEIVPSENFERLNEMSKVIGVITSINEIFHSVYIFFESSNYVFSTNSDSANLKDFVDKSWSDDYADLWENGNLNSNARIYKDIVTKLTYYYVSMYRKINYNGQRGMAVVNIDTQLLKQVIDTTDEAPDQHMLIIADKYGNIMYNTDPALISKDMHSVKELQDIPISRTQSYFRKEDQRGRQIVSVMASDYNDWVYILITAASKYARQTAEFQKFMIFSVAICWLIAICIAFLISLRIYQPIKNMVSIFRTRNDWEDMSRERDGKGFNEFKYLTSNILRSFDMKDEMESELKERLVLLRRAQGIALQAQINPHFLNNTLETLNWKALCLTEGENEVSTMIRYLSKLLRLSLETENSLVTIETEIEHVEYYLAIQNMRYKKKFDIRWDIDQKIRLYKIIKLALQPLVENSIYHGIKPKEGSGTITILAGEYADRIEIHVVDNGIGMPDNEVTEINASLKSEYIKENYHIGLRNVNQRFKLMFGEEYGITLESVYNEYTKVILVLPKIK